MSSKKKDLKKLLTDIAMQDGRLTIDETLIIGNAIRYNTEFKHTLQKALEDGVVDQNEQNELDKLRIKIFEGTTDIAEKDFVITKDESKLLMKLKEYIAELRDTYEPNEE